MLTHPAIYFLNTYGVFLLIAWVLFKLRKSREQMIHVFIAVFVAGAIALFLKEIFDVPRPYIASNIEALAGLSVRTTSFPSLHTTLAFALATIVTLHQRRLGILLFMLAAIVGFGRIVAHVHYPSDVILGAVVGTASALIVENIRIPKHIRRGA